jgi:membrane protease YdiL (CAAX protease family)
LEPTPEWSLGRVGMALVAGVAGGWLATLVGGGMLGLVASGGLTPITIGLGFAAAIFGVLAGVLAVAVWNVRPGPEQLGLRPSPLAPALAWTALVAAPCAALLALGIRSGELADALPTPVEFAALSPTVQGLLGEPVQAQPVPLDAGVVVSAMARAVLPAVATELILRGFFLPALSYRLGVAWAIALTAVLTTAPFALTAVGPDWTTIALPVAGLGVGLGVVYVATGSLYPGVALLACALGLALGGAMGWSWVGASALGLVCAPAALVAARTLAAAWPRGYGYGYR